MASANSIDNSSKVITFHSFCSRDWSGWKGVSENGKPPLNIPLKRIIQGSFGVLLSILVIDLIGSVVDLGIYQFSLASFGASAFLVHMFPSSPFAQPRNVVFSNLISSFIAVLCKLYILHAGCINTSGYNCLWLASSITVFVSTFLMVIFNVPHPPAIATSLGCIYSQKYDGNNDYFFILLPSLSGSALIVLIGLLYNNLFEWSRYPQYW